MLLIFQGVNLMLGTLRSLLLQRLSHGHIQTSKRISSLLPFHCEMSGGTVDVSPWFHAEESRDCITIHAVPGQFNITSSNSPYDILYTV